MPFSPGDVTAGTENELQVAVYGGRDEVDLPRRILESRFYANVEKRSRVGETPRRVLTRLERFLDDNPTGVWENSWVRFPARMLGSEAWSQLQADLHPGGAGPRGDLEQFFLEAGDEQLLRVPISYLLQLALTDAAARSSELTLPIRATVRALRGHFSNDNSSPETSSFHLAEIGPAAGGRPVAREMARRFFLTSLLVAYANQAFGLEAAGQRATIFFSPLPPTRQRQLNDAISDAFYRELFISPCLAWERAEAKKDYMILCHQVLSRSHLSAVAKLREAGILTNNLVVLPQTSNVSLANNGTHLSLGSRKLGAALADPASGFGPQHEKALGDVVIKIVEHFLPLFVGLYSAAPFRLAFADLHPEKALGFLPHQLDFTHLRMVWRRWTKQAVRPFFAQPLRPLGPEWLDRPMSRLLGLRGQFVPDLRLIDYPVALLSTEQSPALDGSLGSGDRLKRDLEDLGVFDTRMSLYLPYKLRCHETMGFSGFEGRHYSLFPSHQDLARAAELQTLVTALAFRYVAAGRFGHVHLPDDPFHESERRQVFFAAALGLPTVYVQQKSGNLFLQSLVAGAQGVRSSRRYKGYLRVRMHHLLRALVERLATDGAELIEAMALGPTIEDLRSRLEHPERSASGRLTRGILATAGGGSATARSPFDLSAEEFNLAAERFYREELRRAQIEEAIDFVAADLPRFETAATPEIRLTLAETFGSTSAASFLAATRRDLLAERLDAETLRRWIVLLVALEHAERSHPTR